MLICPVTLSPCERPACAGGTCFRAATPAFLVCWACGSLEAEGVVHGLCIACVAVHHAQALHDAE